MNNLLYLGIDSGSVSTKIAILDQNQTILATEYTKTNGKPIFTLANLLKEYREKYKNQIFKICVSGSCRNFLADILACNKENEIITNARATYEFHKQARTIIEIGGQDSKLIELVSNKFEITDFAMNETCAAGTGAFLEYLAKRLEINISDFGNLANSSKNPSKISGRCTVFAKTDITHALQNGSNVSDILMGLANALVRNYISNLVKNRTLQKPFVFQGGVSENLAVRKAIENYFNLEKHDLIIPKYNKVMGAIGTALSLIEKSGEQGIKLDDIIKKLQQKDQSAQKLTDLEQTKTSDLSTKFQTKSSKEKNVFLGIDIGSVSSKIVAIEKDENLVFGKYIKNNGDPIGSAKKILAELPADLKILGSCVTGSGRYLVGRLTNANIIKNEITCQAMFAKHANPKAKTIFEIGGQDSKYIKLESGEVTDFEMNKVCAAGTGSFLEEIANKLKININNEWSKITASAKHTLNIGSRCTVFMESDLVHYQQQGFHLSDLSHGISNAVCYNFLEKIVGTKKVDSPIIFQGGVAKNLAVKNAFSKILGQELFVPQNPELSGAFGASLLAKKHYLKKGTTLPFNRNFYETLTSSKFVCNDCENKCEILIFKVDERKIYCGGICGKYEKEEHSKSCEIKYSPLKKRKDLVLNPPVSPFKKGGVYCKNPPPKESETQTLRSLRTCPPLKKGESIIKIGIPRIFLFYDFYPAWKAFFETLGCEVIISSETNRNLIETSLKNAVVETCLPAKTIYGHLKELKDKGVDFIFAPAFVNNDLSKNKFKSNCPYIQNLPQMALANLNVPLLKPTFNNDFRHTHTIPALTTLAKKFTKSKFIQKQAASNFFNTLVKFNEAKNALSNEVLENFKDKDKIFVLLGKQYNILDKGYNLNIPGILDDFNIDYIPYDLLPLNNIDLGNEWDRVKWDQSWDLLKAARYIKDKKNLFPILITNFGCGPDSFIIDYLKRELGNKNLLVLEVDEHTSKGGIKTRIEAYLDSLRKETDLQRSKQFLKIPLSNKKFYMPYISDMSRTFAAAARSIGIDTEALPPSDETSARLGKKYIGGGECFPYILLLGDMIKKAMAPDFISNKSAMYMFGTNSCRLSLYSKSMDLVSRDLNLNLPVICDVKDILEDNSASKQKIKLLLNIWRGLLTSDLLWELLCETRPFEINSGDTDVAYEKAMSLVCEGIENGNLLEKLEAGLKLFDNLSLDRSKKPVKIGLTGDYYTRANSYANSNIIKTIENYGGMVLTSPTFTDTYKYSVLRKFEYLVKIRDVKKGLISLITSKKLLNIQKQILKTFGDRLIYNLEMPYRKTFKKLAPYLSKEQSLGILAPIGNVLDHYDLGAKGIINVITLNCLYGNIVTSSLLKIKKDYGNPPLLTLTYDGLQSTNHLNRIEAFMYKLKKFS